MLIAGDIGGAKSTIRKTASPKQRWACCCNWRRHAASRNDGKPCSRARRSTPRAPRRAACRATRAARRPHRAGRRRCRAGRAPGAGRDGGFRDATARRRVHRQAPSQCGEYRDRRLLSGTRNGLSCATRVQREIDDVPLRRLVLRPASVARARQSHFIQSAR